MKVLCISDRVEQILHGPNLRSYANGVEAVISCGDLPFEYLEYVVTFLGVPLYYVLGNHDPGPEGPKHPGGCTPLDGRIETVGGVTMAGLSGSMLYSGGPNQYTERQMRRRTRSLSARIRYRGMLGKPPPRVIVTHAAPCGLGDREDLCHTGFESFLGLMDRHRPPLWLHGHIHLMSPLEKRETSRGETRVINVYGHRILEV